MECSLLLPVAGRSSRFPGLPPKWLLPHPGRSRMLFEAIRGMDLSRFTRVILTSVSEHANLYFDCDEIVSSLREIAPHAECELVLLDAFTRHQPETVAQTIRLARVNGAFGIKDCDNYFSMTPVPGNTVACVNLAYDTTITAANKSFVQQDEEGRVRVIREKEVISDTFCCGYYGFADARRFMTIYEEHSEHTDLYISQVIEQAISLGDEFRVIGAGDYLDWGTFPDWERYLKRL